MAEHRAHVGGHRFTPVGTGLATVEGAVLVAVEQIHDGALDPGQPLEIADGTGIDVDPSGAFETGAQVADAWLRAVEAACAGPDAAGHVCVPEDALGDGREVHGGLLLRAGAGAFPASSVALPPPPRLDQAARRRSR